MLPTMFQFVIAMIACAINERMQRKLDYTQEEVRVLKEILVALIGSRRISFTADHHQVRVFEPVRDIRRATSTVLDQGIREALPDRAFSPGHWRPTDQEPTRLDE